jgi:hypothetical protein
MGTSSFIRDTQKMILLMLAIFVGICYIIYKMPGGGCCGSCNQGRKPCDCKDKE